MKKLIFAITIMGVLSLVAFSAVLAQDNTPESPPYPGCINCPFGTTGDSGGQILHSYMVSAMAEVLGISIEEFESYREAGLTMFEIAEELNLDIDALYNSMSQVRKDAIEMAFEDGILTQDQYEFLMDRAEFSHQYGEGMSFGGKFGMHYGGNFSGHHGNRMYGNQGCSYGQPFPTD